MGYGRLGRFSVEQTRMFELVVSHIAGPSVARFFARGFQIEDFISCGMISRRVCQGPVLRGSPLFRFTHASRLPKKSVIWHVLSRFRNASRSFASAS